MQNWLPLVYGKLTESPEAPIQIGKDHECTGKNESIPSFVFEQCEPKIIGPGINDLTPWGEYTWLDSGGGIALQHVQSADSVWMVIGRVRGRSESGEGKSGRYYMQGLYLCCPAEDFSPLVLSGLTDIETVPMQEKNMKLPAQGLPLTDGPLDKDWIDRCEMIFETLMAGSPLSIQASKMALGDMARLFQHVLCALPKALAWRLGLRLGAYEMREEVALAHGQRAMSGIRMMGYSTDDFERNRQKTNGYQMLPQWIEEADRRCLRDLSEGARYVQFLRDVTSGCETFSQLTAAVNAHFQELSDWNSAPIDMPWQALAEECTARLFEQDAMKTLEGYLSSPADDLPSLEAIQYYRSEVLSSLLDSPLSISSQLLEYTIRSSESPSSSRVQSWSDAWEDCCQRNPKWRAMSALFRETHNVDTDALKYAQSLSELPKALEPLVSQSLHSQLSLDFKAQKAAPYWSLLFNGSLPQWLSDWREHNAAGLFWLSVRLRRSVSDDSLMKAGQAHSAWQFLSLLKSENAIQESDGRQWCQALPNDADSILDFNSVVDEVMPVNVAHGLQMFGWTDLELPLKRTLEGPGLYSWAPGASTAQDIALRVSKGLTLDPLLLRIVLAYSSHIGDALSKPVLNTMAQGCDSFYQQVFFGADCGSESTHWNPIAEQIVLYRLLSDTEMPKQVYRAVNQPEVSQHQSAMRIRQVLQDKIKEEHQEQPKDRLMQVLFCIGRSTAAPPIETDDIPALAWLMDGFGLPNASELVADLNSIRALIRLQPKQLLLPGVRLLDITRSAEALSEFRAVAEAQNWIEAPVWRLMFITDEPPTQLQKSSNEETQFFAQLEAEACVPYLNAGFLLPDHQLTTLVTHHTDQIQAQNLNDLHRLACMAAHSDSKDFIDAIVRLAFEHAKSLNELDSVLSRYVLPVPWYKKVLSVLDSVSKTVERSLSTKLKMDCKNVSEAVDSLFVTLGRETLEGIYQTHRSSL